MNTAERIYQEAQTLPEAQAREVLDFLEEYEHGAKPKPKSIAAE